MTEFVGYGEPYLITARTYHGQSNSALYKRWQQIKRRIFLPSTTQFKDYGGRGIKIDKRWLKYENFLEDMGNPPDNTYQIDRTDNDWHYCKANCKWVTRLENSLNRRAFNKAKLPKGVRKIKSGRYSVRYNEGKVYTHIGTFDTIEEAHERYLQART